METCSGNRETLFHGMTSQPSLCRTSDDKILPTIFSLHKTEEISNYSAPGNNAEKRVADVGNLA